MKIHHCKQCRKPLKKVGTKIYFCEWCENTYTTHNPAKTIAQQKLFAIALGIKKGQIARSYSAEAAKMADRMSVRKLEEFARTKFNPLQQNLLPELGAAVLAGAGLGIGYKSVNAVWNRVAGKKNPVARKYTYIYKVSWSVTAKVKASPFYAGRGHDTMKVEATSQSDAIETVHLHLQNLFPKDYREGCYNFKAKRLKRR